MALVKAYSNPVFAFLARLPIVGPSPEEYSLPTSSEREQLAQYIDLEGLDVRIDRTEQAIPCGEVDGFRVGPIGVTGITITANAFEDPRYLSAIATHELGHLERKDTLLNATVVTKILGLVVFGGVLFNLVSFWSLLESGHFSIASLTFLAFGVLIWELRRFNSQSRDAEFEADRLSVEYLGSQENLRALLKAYEENRDEGPSTELSLTDRLLGPEHHPHPSIRLERLDSESRSRQQA